MNLTPQQQNKISWPHCHIHNINSWQELKLKFQYNFQFHKGDVIEFDFQKKTMQFGPREKLLSPLQVRHWLQRLNPIYQSSSYFRNIFFFIPNSIILLFFLYLISFFFVILYFLNSSVFYCAVTEKKILWD